MTKLLSIARIGLVSMALVLLPASVSDAELSRSNLCASESGQCKVEIGSYCAYGGVPIADYTNKS